MGVLAKKVKIFLIVFFTISAFKVEAISPIQPILPSDNIQDPGSLSTPWGGCTPSDTNCYVAVNFFNDETVEGLDYSTSTGILSLTSGYTIPTTASTTAWNSTLYSLSSSTLVQNGNSFGTTLTLGTNDNNGLSLETNSIQRLTIDTSGNVNITGALTLGSALADGQFIKSGDWTGLFDGQEGSYYLDRTNQTGTQLALTISDFATSTKNLLSSSITGLSYSTTTGAFSLTSGYEIPLTASTTEWSNKVSSQWVNSASNIYYMTGNVGVGTTTPTEKLAVEGNILTTGSLTTGSILAGASDVYDIGTTNSTNRFRWGYFAQGISSGSSGFGLTLKTASALPIYLQTNSATRMTIDATGNVGIGTSTPSARLHTLSTTEQLRLGYNSSNYWTNTIGSTGELTMQGVGTGGSLTLSPTAGQNINLALSGAGDFAVNSNHLYVDTSTGFVGIGTTTPTEKLAIDGNVLLTGSIKFTPKSAQNITQSIFTDASDQLVLGTTSFGKRVLLGSSGTTYALGSVFQTGGFTSNSYTAATVAGLFKGAASQTADLLQMQNSSGNVLSVFNKDGYLGVGTTTPAANLHVIGTGEQLRLAYDANNYSVFSAKSNGDLNINPIGSLWVQGYGGLGSFNVGTGGSILVNSAANSGFTGGGNVGVGTTTPIQRFSVIGGGSTSATYSMSSAPSTGISSFRVRDDGKVFVGLSDVTNSVSVLNINGDTYTSGDMVVGGTLYASTVAGKSTFNLRLANYNTPYVYLTRDFINSQDLKFGIGTSTPSARLDVYGSAGSGDIFAISSSTNARLLTMTSGGSLGIGTSTPTEKLSVIGNGQFTAVGSGAYAFDLNLTSTGVLTTSASDERLKENIMTISSTSTLEKISLLRPVTFDWKTNGSHDIGLIAQEVEQIFPELVFTNPTDGYKGVNYSRFISLLISSIQEISVKLNKVLTWFVNDKFNIQGDVCVEDICVTKQQFKQILINSQAGQVQSPAPAPTPAPDTTPAPEPSPTPDPEIPAEETEETVAEEPVAEPEVVAEEVAPTEAPAPIEPAPAVEAPVPTPTETATE